MKIVCAYCHQVYGDNGKPVPEGLPPNAVSHGACPPCEKKANADLDKWIVEQGKGSEQKTVDNAPKQK